MRTPLLATLFGLSLVACAGQIDGGGTPGDDDVGANCGNGVIDQGETCDDSNIANGDGCSSTCQTEAVPRVALTVDRGSVTTDLGVENTFTITATAEMGFKGGVVLSTSVVDAANAPITGWTATLAGTTLDLSSATTATTTFKLTIPGNHANLVGTVKISGSSSGPAAETNISVTANPVLAITFTNNGSACVYPQGINNSYHIKAGRTIKVFNGATAGSTMTIHVDPTITGFSHQNTGTTIAVGASHDGTPTVAADQGEFYCHNGIGNLTDGASGNLHSLLTVDP